MVVALLRGHLHEVTVAVLQGIRRLGACRGLDPFQPPQRLQGIFRRTIPSRSSWMRRSLTLTLNPPDPDLRPPFKPIRS